MGRNISKFTPVSFIYRTSNCLFCRGGISKYAESDEGFSVCDIQLNKIDEDIKIFEEKIIEKIEGNHIVEDVADLREFEEFADILTDVEKLPLYQSALKQFEEGGIPYRCLRTEMVHCSSDVEYLGKLHCIRLAFQWLFRDQTSWYWFADNGRQVLTDLLLFADKDPKDFLIAYEEMLKFLQDQQSWDDVEQELSAKGVKAMTFYDVVMDYILMDAFEDLDTPPSSVTAVVQNRWLSNGFKESALTTAVWSVLKAKRQMLRYPRGFMAHFYAISEQMSPLMAWGFLGPDEKLREMCFYFREQVMGFLTDIFSFQKTRYTSVEELSSDLLSHIKIRVDNITHKLSSETQLSYSLLKGSSTSSKQLDTSKDV